MSSEHKHVNIREFDQYKEMLDESLDLRFDAVHEKIDSSHKCIENLEKTVGDQNRKIDDTNKKLDNLIQAINSKNEEKNRRLELKKVAIMGGLPVGGGIASWLIQEIAKKLSGS